MSNETNTTGMIEADIEAIERRAEDLKQRNRDLAADLIERAGALVRAHDHRAAREHLAAAIAVLALLPTISGRFEYLTLGARELGHNATGLEVYMARNEIRRAAMREAEGRS